MYQFLLEMRSSSCSTVDDIRTLFEAHDTELMGIVEGMKKLVENVEPDALKAFQA